VVSLQETLQLSNIAVYNKRSTGEKFLINRARADERQALSSALNGRAARKGGPFAFALRCRKIFLRPRQQKLIPCTCIFLAIWRKEGQALLLERDIQWPPTPSSPSSARFARRAFAQVANALAKLAPASLKLDVTTLEGISFFNQDLEANPPADWLAFREKLQKSSGVLFITPEYNRSIPGVLKNAIDVSSRPYGKSSFLGKPVGIISNSPGALGGVSAAKHLQNILPGIAGPILGQPNLPQRHRRSF
jgi:NAD(P)H-dependent FMN reductase